MANFCENCGTKLTPDAAFCPGCGAKTAQSTTDGVQTRRDRSVYAEPNQSKPVNRYPNYRYGTPLQAQQRPQQPQQQYQERPAGRKLPNGLVILTVALAVILAIEGVVAGVWYPGFFNPQKGVVSDVGVSGSGDTPGIPSPESINIDYTDKERADAPVIKMGVSADAPSAKAEDFSVDFGCLSGLSDNDTFNVRVLPEHSFEKEGYSVQGYDFSLDSGTDKFRFDVAVTIPRAEGDGDIVTFLSRNPETGKIEKEYFEISDDGSSYVLYTKHFSDHVKVSAKSFAEKLISSAKQGDLSDSSTREALSAFYLSGKTAEDQIMTENVNYSSYDLWKKVSGKYTDALPSTDGLLEALSKKVEKEGAESVNLAAMMFDSAKTVGEKTVEYADTANNIKGGIAESSAKIMEALSVEKLSPGIEESLNKYKAFSDKTEAASTYLGAITTIVGYVMLDRKISKEIEQGKFKDDTEAQWSHRSDCVSTILGCISTLSGIVGTAAKAAAVKAAAAGTAGATAAGVTASAATGVGIFCALAALGIYCYSMAAAPKYEELDVFEQNYRDYFYRDKNSSVCRVFFYDREFEDAGKDAFMTRDTDVDLGISNIKKISVLSPEQNEKFKKLINEDLKEINDQPGGFVGSDPRIGYICLDFAVAVNYLFLLVASENPEKAYDAVIEFYRNYAESCWDSLTEGDYLEYSRNNMARRGQDSNSAQLPWKNDKEFQNVKKAYRDKFVDELFAASSEALLTMFRSFQHETERSADMAIEKELLPLLNTRVEFSVEDESLETPADFSRSVYNADPKELSGWQNGYVKYLGKYDDVRQKYESPMEFYIKTENGEYTAAAIPAFLPGEFIVETKQRYDGAQLREVRLVNVSEAKYFPAVKNFWPKLVKGTGNVVFRCTYYHYLMMGAPTAMSFYDVNDENSEEKIIDFEMPKKSDADGVMRVNISVKGENESAPEGVHTLRMRSDNASGYDPNSLSASIYEDREAVPDASSLTLNTDDSVDLSVQSLDVTWKHSFSATEHSSKAGTETVNYKNDGFSTRGQLAYTYEEKEYGKTVKLHKYYVLTDCPAISGSENVLNNYTYYTGTSIEYSETKTGVVKKTLESPVLYADKASIKPEKGDKLSEFSDKYKGSSYIKLTYDASGKKLKSAVLSIEGTVTEDIDSDYRGKGAEVHENQGFSYTFTPID